MVEDGRAGACDVGMDGEGIVDVGIVCSPMDGKGPCQAERTAQTKLRPV
jgi:hypothetical protein